MTISVWIMVAILYQTFLCIILSWFTLGCRLAPDSSELHEITLMKMLYLYEPESCGRLHFYNYTVKVSSTNNRLTTAVIWPLNNYVAASFRRKVQAWLILHLLWTVLAVANITQSRRPCAFYVTLVPFTIIGIAILVLDVVFAGLFLSDAKYTGTENAIIHFINKQDNVRSVSRSMEPAYEEADTSWIAVLLAYGSIRGVVQWVINFWIVKDCYFDGLAAFHHLQNQIAKTKCSKSDRYSHVVV